MNISSRGNPPLGRPRFFCHDSTVQDGSTEKGRESGSVPTRILLVDDEVLICQVCTRVLRHLGYQTETANDGAAAWEAIQANIYDLLITDNNMPKVSGVELVEKVRSANMSLPVILVSGNLPTGELNRNPRLKGVVTLAKPFTGDELLGTVNKVLRESASYKNKPSRCPSSAKENSATEQTFVSNHGCL